MQTNHDDISLAKPYSDFGVTPRPANQDSTTATHDLKVIRRNGSVVPFEPIKILVAITKAFIATHGDQAAASARIRELAEQLTQTVTKAILRNRPHGGTAHIEDIQDHVELALMRSGEHDVARAYVLYREERSRSRTKESPGPHIIHAITPQGESIPLSQDTIEQMVASTCHGLEADPKPIATATMRDLYEGVPYREVLKSAILSARTLIEKDPVYDFVTARLLLKNIQNEVLGFEVTTPEEIKNHYAEHFEPLIRRAVQAELLDSTLLEFDLSRLAQVLRPERDDQFRYLGLQTLYDRYFLHIHDQRIELPQIFFMRVAMGLALNEVQREERAIEFYLLLSSFDFMSSTPTLFNSGTRRSQLSSCYLTTVADDLDQIYEAIKENALLSKFAGGIGNDWTQVRAMGARIKGTNGKSQGVVPFLKVVNDTAVAVNQGGKRKGAVCSYLETWHLDIEEFLELRKNTGDDRRRTHDMNTANWIPDLFMKRVMLGADWTLFSPSDVPDLHDRFGADFEAAYIAHEEATHTGQIILFKRVSAAALWRKMLTMLFETGHPWITFKDPCNIRSPQQHVGVVHSSNLCTEITLNTNEQEIAVCNLGSINLLQHLYPKNHPQAGQLNVAHLQQTINTAMRMLDNVIDINFYAVKKARQSNLKHRPVGLGLMGFQDALHQLGIPFASDAAVEFADYSMEAIAYYAYWASTELAKERGRYGSYEGSLWSKGILPQDSIDLLEQSRSSEFLQVDRSSRLDWTPLRQRIQQYGMRNSNCLAIAPTATISNIIGVSASIEPTYQNVYVKSNLSGEFTIVTEELVHDLKQAGLWDEVMRSDLKYFDGSLAKIDRIPQPLRELYATAFEIEPRWLVEAAARRQKWIDQAQSLNLYMKGASGRKLDETYKLAWIRGLKTTYYLRTLGATAAEKSTIHTGSLNAVEANAPTENPFCAIDNPECEACQ